MDFSRLQIKNLVRRNELTQKMLDVTNNAKSDKPSRIASERNREYVLVKNEGTGYTMMTNQSHTLNSKSNKGLGTLEEPLNLVDSSESEGKSEYETDSEGRETEEVVLHDSTDMKDGDALSPRFYNDDKKGDFDTNDIDTGNLMLDSSAYVDDDETIDSVMAKFQALESKKDATSPICISDSDDVCRESIDMCDNHDLCDSSEPEVFCALWLSQIIPEFQDEYANYEDMIQKAVFEWDVHEILEQKSLASKKLGKIREGDDKKEAALNFWLKFLQAAVQFRKTSESTTQESDLVNSLADSTFEDFNESISIIEYEQNGISSKSVSESGSESDDVEIYGEEGSKPSERLQSMFSKERREIKLKNINFDSMILPRYFDCHLPDNSKTNLPIYAAYYSERLPSYFIVEDNLAIDYLDISGSEKSPYDVILGTEDMSKSEGEINHSTNPNYPSLAHNEAIQLDDVLITGQSERSSSDAEITCVDDDLESNNKEFSEITIVGENIEKENLNQDEMSFQNKRDLSRIIANQTPNSTDVDDGISLHNDENIVNSLTFETRSASSQILESFRDLNFGMEEVDPSFIDTSTLNSLCFPKDDIEQKSRNDSANVTTEPMIQQESMLIDENSVEPKIIEPSINPDESFIPSDTMENDKDEVPQSDNLKVDDAYENADSSDEDINRQMNEENSEFARFLSELQNKDINSIQIELTEEIDRLNEQQKKEKRDADSVTQLMINDCQKLLELFGIPFINAPMEAEAQCVELLRLDLVDGIITDDSDVFLFGGTRVYKNFFDRQKYVEYYLAQDFESELKLDREKLIRLALLLGGDYSEGLPGVGVVNAMEILNEFPDEDGLENFRDWWIEVQNGSYAPDDNESEFKKKFRRRMGNLFLSKNFPNRHIKDMYLNPQVDDSKVSFQWGVPDMEELKDFLMDRLLWPEDKVDQTLLPVIKTNMERQSEKVEKNLIQTSIDNFFDHTSKRSASHKSKRIRRIVDNWRKDESNVTAENDDNFTPTSSNLKRKFNASDRHERDSDGSTGSESFSGEEEKNDQGIDISKTPDLIPSDTTIKKKACNEKKLCF